MGILPDYMLRHMGPELVDPFVVGNVQPASIDLCLHTEFIVFEAHKTTVIDMDNMQDSSPKKVNRTREQGFILHPGEFILAATAERVVCPSDTVARLEGKSSVGRIGVMIHVTAGFVDPGWEGRLTLEVFNLRKVPIILRPGRPFCQVSFTRMEAPAAQPYQGRYQGADSVQESRYPVQDEIVKAFNEGFEEGGVNERALP